MKRLRLLQSFRAPAVPRRHLLDKMTIEEISNNPKEHNLAVDFDTLKQSSIVGPAFERLSVAYQYFPDRDAFKDSVSKCRQYYRKQSASFLEDLMQFPQINNQLIQFLFLNYSRSKAVRSFILDEMCYLVKRKSIPEFNETLKWMEKHGIVGSEVYSEFHNLDRMADRVVRQAVVSGEQLLALSFALMFNKENYQIEGDTLRLISQALIIDSSISHSYNSYGIFKLIQAFKLGLGETELSKLLAYLIEGDYSGSILFSNLFYDQYLSSKDFSKIDPEVILRLIDKNIAGKNFRRAMKLWEKVGQMCGVSVDLRLKVLISLLEGLQLEGRNDELDIILKSTPDSLKSRDDVFDFLIKHYGTNELLRKEFEEAMTRLSPPLRRLTLSLLFVLFISQGNTAEAQKLLDHIIHSKDGMNYTEFGELINTLLRKEGPQHCTEMVLEADVKVSRLGIVSVIRHIFENESPSDWELFLDSAISKLIKLPALDTSRSNFTKEVVGYVSKHVSNRAARALLSRVYHLGSNQVSKVPKHFSIDLMKYGLPNSLSAGLVSTMSSRMDCLQLILNRAVDEEDLDTFRWCVEKLRYDGMIASDLIEQLRSLNSDFVNSVIIEST